MLIFKKNQHKIKLFKQIKYLFPYNLIDPNLSLKYQQFLLSSS